MDWNDRIAVEVRWCNSSSSYYHFRQTSYSLIHFGTLKPAAPSIHPAAYLNSGCGGISLSREAQTSLIQPVLPAHLGKHWDIPKPAKRCTLQRDLDLPWGILPVGRAHNTSPRRRPGGIVIRCLYHLKRLLLYGVVALLSVPFKWPSSLPYLKGRAQPAPMSSKS